MVVLVLMLLLSPLPLLVVDGVLVVACLLLLTLGSSFLVIDGFGKSVSKSKQTGPLKKCAPLNNSKNLLRFANF